MQRRLSIISVSRQGIDRGDYVDDERETAVPGTRCARTLCKRVTDGGGMGVDGLYNE